MPTAPAPLTYPQPCPALYSQDRVPRFGLTIDEASLAALRLDHLDKTWRPAVFEYEGESWDVQVKNRGNSRCGTKLQLSIAFNKVDRNARFQGLRRLHIDHGHCRILDERLMLAFLREDLGEPAPCANHALVDVNGGFEGLYTNLEVINKDWLTRNFGPDGNDGNLWKEGFYLETNEETGTRDVIDAFRHAETLDEIEALADVDHAVRYWAWEAVIPATDNFWVDGWNYFLYEHPDRGIVFIPRDYDKATPWKEQWVTFDPMALDSRHHPVPIVLADPDWNAAYRRALADVFDRYDPAVFEERQDQYWEQVHLYAADDPAYNVTPSSPPPSYVLQGIRDRVEWLNGRLAPAPFD